MHWLQALVPATSIVSSAPSRSSDAKSTAYDTDIVEPLVASGRLTLSADASDEQSSSGDENARVVDGVRDEEGHDRRASDDHGGDVHTGGERKFLHTTRLDFLAPPAVTNWGSR